VRTPKRQRTGAVKTWRAFHRAFDGREASWTAVSPSAFAARHSAASADGGYRFPPPANGLLKTSQTFLASFADGFRLEECENDLAKKSNIIA